ncbi:MAG: glycosyltransferase [Myxococcales bacterium]|nr:glycosyltransferase [Myxococcales bacterium]
MGEGGTNGSALSVVDVIIVARDADATLAEVVAALPSRVARSVVVVDQGSTDRTMQVAQAVGAIALRATGPGYGAACQRGLTHLASLPRPPDCVVFLAADGSDDAAELPRLVHPLRESLFDLVIGVRPRRTLSPVRAATFIAGRLIEGIYGERFRDFGSFRAIRYPALVALGLRDVGAGWSVEMQVKAARLGLRTAEVPVSRLPGRASPFKERLADAAATGTRGLYHILRHSTTR